MKVNDSVRKNLITVIKASQSKYNILFVDAICGTKTATIITSLLSTKRNLLRNFVINLPIKATHCYFCMENSSMKDGCFGIMCDRCAYGKFHNKCDNTNADYKKIQVEQNNLLSTINLYMNPGYDYKVPRLNQKVISKIITRLNRYKNYMNNLFDDFIKDIDTAVSVEKIMEYKKVFLIDLMDEGFPLGADTCYFCIKNDSCCKKCTYGEVHEICGVDKSDYEKILVSNDKFIEVLSNYYKGEAYKEEIIKSKLHGLEVGKRYFITSTDETLWDNKVYEVEIKEIRRMNNVYDKILLTFYVNGKMRELTYNENVFRIITISSFPKA